MKPLIVPFPGHAALALELSNLLNAEVGKLEWRHFPDGESLVTVDENFQGADVAILLSLNDPDKKVMALRFAAETMRELGAKSVGLIAPYLSYMRQDRRFHPGEAVSAPLFAKFIEQSFDWMITVDPHLHRNPSLSSLYKIPTQHVSAAPAVAQWLVDNVPDAMLIGPDSESSQWVEEIAKLAHAPFQVLQKQRHGDRDVSVSLPDLNLAKNHTVVIVDDIVSSGRTIIETINQLTELGLKKNTCIAIHPIFADNSFSEIKNSGAIQIVSTNTIAHESNKISVASLLASAYTQLDRPDTSKGRT